MNDRRRAIERILEQRPSKPLQHGDHMLITYALRCRCQVCERILTWSDCDEQGLMTVECCQRLYTLKPWTVKVWIEDVSTKGLLDSQAGSDYPNADVKLRLEGGAEEGVGDVEA